MKPSDHPFAASAVISVALVLGGFFAVPIIETAISGIPRHLIKYSMLIIPLSFVFTLLYYLLSMAQIAENELKRDQQLPQRIEALTCELAKLATDASISNSKTQVETREAAVKLEAAAALLSHRLNAADA